MDKIEFIEAGNSIRKFLLDRVPHVGGFLNEFIDWRSRVKQERLNTFILLLSDYFSCNPISNTDVFTTEDFGDLFESVVKRAISTKSKEKHARFRDILTNYIENPETDLNDVEIFLDLVNELNEIAIIILKYHQVFDKDYYIKDNRVNDLTKEIEDLKTRLAPEAANNSKGYANSYYHILETIPIKQKALNDLTSEISVLAQYRTADFYKISDDEFLYYKQILSAKGLLTDKGIGAISTPAFFRMGITEFGKKFITFIISN